MGSPGGVFVRNSIFALWAANPQGIEGWGLAGPMDTILTFWTPYEIRPCREARGTEMALIKGVQRGVFKGVDDGPSRSWLRHL
jgi:hypothetical protein